MTYDFWWRQKSDADGSWDVNDIFLLSFGTILPSHCELMNYSWWRWQDPAAQWAVFGTGPLRQPPILNQICLKRARLLANRLVADEKRHPVGTIFYITDSRQADCRRQRLPNRFLNDGNKLTEAKEWSKSSGYAKLTFFHKSSLRFITWQWPKEKQILSSRTFVTFGEPVAGHSKFYRPVAANGVRQ